MPSLYHPSFIPVRIRNAQFFGEHVPAVVAAAFTEKNPRPSSTGREPGGLLPREEEGLFERFSPAAARGGAGIFGGAVFKEIRMLHAVEHFVHPR